MSAQRPAPANWPPVLSAIYGGQPLRVRLDDTIVTSPTDHEFTPAGTTPEASALVLIPRQ